MILWKEWLYWEYILVWPHLNKKNGGIKWWQNYENHILIQIGITSQCVFCSQVFSNDSIRPTKIKQHLEKFFLSNVMLCHKGKDKSFFERNMNLLKKIKLGATRVHYKTNNET